jgi:hypothetical protein
VLPADRTPLENLGAALVGEEASPVAQLSLLAGMLLLVLLFSRRRRKVEPNDAWDEVSDALTVGLFTDREEQVRQKRPEGPPPSYLFQSDLQTAPSGTAPNHNGPPLPPSGLPEGWTMEQWEHYGQQYLDSQA